MARNVIPARDRFWAKVDRRDPAECWPWTASKNWRGVGLFGDATGHMVSAPRFCWELTSGAIPTGAHVLHSCDNPSCCNPDHLFLGNHASNMRDKALKGRARRGLEKHSRLTDAQVAEAARLREQGIAWAELGRRLDTPYQTVRRRVLKAEAAVA